MSNKTQSLNQNLNSGQNQKQEKPKNFWQKLKKWQKVGIILVGLFLFCIIIVRLLCVLPISGFSLDRTCQKDSDCIPVSCGCLNEKGAKNLKLRGVFCGMHFLCFPPSSCVCKNEHCASLEDWKHYNDSVDLSTDKKEYKQEEKIKLKIENTLSEEIIFDSISLECYQNNNWQKFVSDIYCDCNEECKKLPMSIEAFMNEEYNWDQKKGLCNDLLLDGKFRFKISLWDNSINRPKMIYYSNEFTIKEKTALDPRCGEKVIGIGTCKRLAIGYEFDSSLGKCIEKRVGGCSFETPFETLEKCQEVCEKKINISNWQTYRNEEFGFEMKYPEDFEIFDDYPDKKIVFIGTNGIHRSPIEGISIRMVEDNILDLKNKIKNRDEFTTVLIEEQIIINSIEVEKLVVTAAIGYNDAHYFFNKDNKTYEIIFDSENRIQEKILSTFKFTE